MKKMGKKINLLVKVILLVCMLFTEIASPIKVFADELSISEYELSFVQESEDKFKLTSTGDMELNELDTYVVKVTRKFRYTDGDYEEEKIEYYNYLGSELTHGVNLERKTFDYNGTSLIDVNVYEIVDKTIIDGLSTYDESSYETLLLSNKVNMIMDTSFEEDIDNKDFGITYVVTINDDIVSVIDDKVFVDYLLEEEAVSNNVSVKYTVNTGNLNPNKEYVGLIYVNDELFDIYNGTDFTLNYMNLIGGVYNVRLDIVEKGSNDIVCSKNIEFNYDAIYDLQEYYSSLNDSNIEYGFISYTSLNEEEKEELGKDYLLFDNYLAFCVDRLLSDKDIVTNYNLFDGDVRYHVASSNYFMAMFDEDNITYTVNDLLDYFVSNIVFDEFLIYVTNNDELVEGNSFLVNGMKLHFNLYGEEVVYDLLVKGDVNGGLLTQNDIADLISKLLNDDISFYDKLNLDLNFDSNIDILDVSLMGYNIFKGEFIGSDRVLKDNIVAIIEKDDSYLRVGDQFEVVLKLSGFEYDYINAIYGMINYDSDAFSLVNVDVLNDYFVGEYTKDEFMYASIYTYGENDLVFVRLLFNALKEGTFDLSLDGIRLVFDGNSFDTISSNELEIFVDRKLHTISTLDDLESNYGRFDKEFNSGILDYTLYVDSYVSEISINGILSDSYAKTDDFGNYMLNGDNTLITINVVAEDGTNTIYRVNVVKVYKSSNNNLSDIVIDGIELDFDKDVLEYNVTVDYSVNELDISAIVEDYRSWAKIEGNENFKTGNNVVTIKVYAEDGSTKVYTINVNKKEQVKEPSGVSVVDDDKEGNVGTEKTIIIILIILIVIGLLYLIFKKDEDTEEIKITEIKAKKDSNNKINKK